MESLARAPIPQSAYSRHRGAHTHNLRMPRLLRGTPPRPLATSALGALPRATRPRGGPLAWSLHGRRNHLLHTGMRPPTLSCTFYTCPRGTEARSSTRTPRAPPCPSAARALARRAADAPAAASRSHWLRCACMNPTATWSSALLSTMRRHVRTVAETGMVICAASEC